MSSNTKSKGKAISVDLFQRIYISLKGGNRGLRLKNTAVLLKSTMAKIVGVIL